MIQAPAPLSAPDLPLATYFANAGLSERDAIDLERHVRQELKKRIRALALAADPGDRFRYLNDRAHRTRVNREITADIILGAGFSQEELRVIDKGLRLGLTDAAKPTTATVHGAAGEATFSVVEESRGPGGNRYVLEEERTGEHEVVE